MRRGTVKWHTGKHPVVACFTPFLADLEELVGEGEVSHAKFAGIRYHPPKPVYSSHYCETTKTLTITAKYRGFVQKFHVDARDSDYLLILQAFVEHYPDENFMDYIVKEPTAGELENRLANPHISEKQIAFGTVPNRDALEYNRSKIRKD